MQARETDRLPDTTRARASVRRIGGPLADQISLVCRPVADLGSVERQAEAVYETMLDALREAGAGPEAIIAETIFLRRVRDDLPAARAARARVVGAAGRPPCRPATTAIGQPPLTGDAALEVAALAVVPRVPGAAAAGELVRAVACRCTACAPGVRARLVRLGDQVGLYAGNVHGRGRSAFDEAYDMFRVARDLLADAGMAFGDVIRTWIHLRDIARDYDALNAARRAFFADCDLTRRPASTGVQGIPPSDAHAFSLGLQAVRGGPLDVAVMSTPTLNEAWSYGADFSRGLRVVDANMVALHVSGTASIDHSGRTIHPGDLPAQVGRTLHNIRALLDRQGASAGDVVSGVAYVARREDGPRVRALLRAGGFDGFPCALVEAPLCRPDLLCEAEVLALLPPAAATS